MVTMVQRRSERLALALAVFDLVMLLLAILLMLVNSNISYGIAGYLFAFNAFLPVGWLIASRRAENAIGWLFLLIAGTTNLAWVMEEYARVSLVTAPGSLPGAVWVAWLVSPIQPLAWILMFTSLLLFPTGGPINHAWHVFIWANIVYFEVSTTLAACTSPFLNYFPDIHNPLYLGNLGGLSQIAEGISGFVNVAALGIAGVMRFRRANLIEKQQLKWFTYSLMLLPLSSIAQLVAQSVFQVPAAILNNLTVLFILPPVAATGIAILRYRLYDIDLIVRRTLLYAVLTAMLGLVYWGGVAALQQILRPISGEGNDLAVVATTLLIAALFLPLRAHIQGFIDRRFYRRKYDAAKTMLAFSATVRDEVDLETLTGQLVEVVDQTMQPSYISVWLLN